MKLRVIALLLAVGAFACKSKNYDTTASGMQYKIYTNNTGPKPKLGDIVKIQYAVSAIGKGKNGKDSVLMSTWKMGNPVPAEIMKPSFKGDPMEGFTMMSKGDSAEFLVSADSLMKMQPNFPGAHPGEFMKFTVKMVDIMTRDQFMNERKAQQEEMMKEQDAINAQQDVEIQNFLKQKGWKAEKTDKGLYYIIEKKGTGPNAKAGDSITVRYTGKLLNGNVFDSNTQDGITFQLGMGQVIPGWDQGFTLFNKGTKATLVIPSKMAYGPRGAGSSIPPNAVLVFDVEVMKIK